MPDLPRLRARAASGAAVIPPYEVWLAGSRRGRCTTLRTAVQLAEAVASSHDAKLDEVLIYDALAEQWLSPRRRGRAPEVVMKPRPGIEIPPYLVDVLDLVEAMPAAERVDALKRGEEWCKAAARSLDHPREWMQFGNWLFGARWVHQRQAADRARRRERRRIAALEAELERMDARRRS